MANIFCLRCKKRTASKNVRVHRGASKDRISAECAICDTKKSQFIKKGITGDGILGTIGDIIGGIFGI